MKLVLWIIIILSAKNSYSQKEKLNKEILYIKYTSKSHLPIGPGEHSITIQDEKLTYFDSDGVSKTKNLTKKELDKILNTIDTYQFFRIKKKLNCQSCQDGSTHYLEISYKNKKRKVGGYNASVINKNLKKIRSVIYGLSNFK